MPAWLSRILLFLARCFLSPTVARNAGRAEAEAAAEIDHLKKTVELKDEHLEIAARPRLGRDDLLKRMRESGL